MKDRLYIRIEEDIITIENSLQNSWTWYITGRYCLQVWIEVNSTVEDQVFAEFEKSNFTIEDKLYIEFEMNIYTQSLDLTYDNTTLKTFSFFIQQEFLI